MEPELFGGENRCLDLSSIHVSADVRGGGTGGSLFRAAKLRAKGHGTRKLCISAHSALETQRFYEKMGCTEAVEYDRGHVKREPFDCRLECRL